MLVPDYHMLTTRARLGVMPATTSVRTCSTWLEAVTAGHSICVEHRVESVVVVSGIEWPGARVRQPAVFATPTHARGAVTPADTCRALRLRVRTLILEALDGRRVRPL